MKQNIDNESYKKYTIQAKRGIKGEAFFEAFANVYRSAYDAMELRAAGKPFERVDTVYPNINDGVDGMNFITQCVASSKEQGAWLPLRHERARR